MKIDYELVEKIGATHWHTGNFDFYKEDCGELLAYTGGKWRQSLITAANAMLLLKPIPPKRTRTEYEKVTESIFDLRDEFERGELYSYYMNGKHTKVTNEDDLLENYKDKNLYRKVEKEIDWRDEVHRCLSGIGYHWATPIAEVINDDESDYFLELCRVALRANGELD